MAIRIGNLLKGSLQRLGVSKEVSAAIVCSEFDRIFLEIMGELKGQAKAMHLKNGILSVAVLSSSVAQEIRLHEQEILEKLSRKFSSNIVKKLRYLL